MASTVVVTTPDHIHGYLEEEVTGVVEFGPDLADKKLLVLIGENNKKIGVYNSWISAVDKEHLV